MTLLSIVLIMVFVTGCSLFKSTTKDLPTPEMVLIEGGIFTMGDGYERKNPDSTPVHEVTLPDFKIGKYEVTYEEFDAFAKRTDRKLPESDSMGRGSRAVAFVDWYDAKAFCEFHGWRLPTEQEWEYAAPKRR